MSITPETRHAISKAIWLTWLIVSTGVVGAFLLSLRNKGKAGIRTGGWKAISRAEYWNLRLRFGCTIFLLGLCYQGADKVLKRIPTRNPPPPAARPLDPAAAESLRLRRERTLTFGDDVVITWGRPTGVAAATAKAAHEIFDPGAAPAGLPASGGGKGVYKIASGTKALFRHYEAFPDRNIACVILEDGPHALKSAWVPGERLRRAAR